jgi:hypothetical protein
MIPNYSNHFSKNKSAPPSQMGNGFLKWGVPYGGRIPNFFKRYMYVL